MYLHNTICLLGDVLGSKFTQITLISFYEMHNREIQWLGSSLMEE